MTAETQHRNSPELNTESDIFVKRMTNDPDSETWMAGEILENQIFKVAGYVDDEGNLKTEYEKYGPVSKITVLSNQEEPFGVLRIIDYDEEIGFKTTNDIKEGRLAVSPEGDERLSSIDPNLMCEAATVGVEYDHRKVLIDDLPAAMQLFAVYIAYARDNGKPFGIASYDEKFLARNERIFGPGLVRIGPATEYMGSPTVPVLIDFQAFSDYLHENGLAEFEEALLTIGRKVSHDD